MCKLDKDNPWGLPVYSCASRQLYRNRMVWQAMMFDGPFGSVQPRHESFLDDLQHSGQVVGRGLTIELTKRDLNHQ